jgi:aldehyde dehydrogenase (NAD+)
MKVSFPTTTQPAFFTGVSSGGRGRHTLLSISPVDGKQLGEVRQITRPEYDRVIDQATTASIIWRQTPAPRRGEIVRQLGDAFRKHKALLGQLVSYEMGKSKQEGLGEVQEIIDICDYAVGLSRQLYGLTLPSERPAHKMLELWHPVGVVGIISAFNFPVAVWSWNAMIALVCGNATVWKPSEKTPFCAQQIFQIIKPVLKANRLPEGLVTMIQGNAEVGSWLAQDIRIPVLSATGSVRMGRSVGQQVAARMGRSILELGGNNAIIVTPSASLPIALTGILFGAIGTAGQRCTSTRRLIIHESIFPKLVKSLVHAYSQVKIGNPLDEKNNMGPLIDHQAVETYLQALRTIESQGGKILTPYGRLEGKGFESGCYVMPCIVQVRPNMPMIQTETFAPILYVMKYKTIEEAIQIQNGVPQGLSSAILTQSIKESELFISSNGSDSGIANINIGTSGAEIGGAFGGEKETGGGRESGSDSWKGYMRRQTVTVNFSDQIPLAQGIQFEL